MRKFKAENIITFTPAGGSRVYLSPLNNSDVITEEGTGMPPIDYITEQGPYQHGVTAKTYRLQPRIVQYRLRQQFCSSAAYATGRHDLLDLLRPNRPEGITGVLTKYLPNRTTRSLDVAIAEGPGYKARALNRWDEWAIDEVIRFIAFNPIAYDPVGHTETWTHPSTTHFPYVFAFPFSVPAELVFPATFPISFYDFDITDSIIYAGNWVEYPTIVVTGPAEYIEVRNITTNEKIALSGFLLPATRTLTIDLTYSVKRITLDDGTNLQPYLTADSDFSSFHLEPGINEFAIIVRGSGSLSQVVMTWKDRYIGY